MKTGTVPVIIGAHGVIKKGLEKQNPRLHQHQRATKNSPPRNCSPAKEDFNHPIKQQHVPWAQGLGPAIVNITAEGKKCSIYRA